MNIQIQWEHNPMIVIWEITRACALACTNCRDAAVSHNDPRELGTTEARHFIDQVARANPQTFILTGGDPTYRPDLVQLIQYASEQGLRVAMNPSATPRFLKADMKIFRDAGLRTIALKIDGASQTTHDAFRGTRGKWEWTMQAYKAARQAGNSLQINTTITRQNIGEFDAFVELLNGLEPEAWNLFPLVPIGRARMEDMPSGEQLEDLFDRLHDLAPVVNYEIKTTEGQHYRRVVLQRWKNDGGRKPKVNSVNDGKGLVFVSHIGEICPSGFLPLSAGNVRENELIDVYRDAPIFRELRDQHLLKGKCGRCEYLNVCGGSRARSYAVSGDYLAEEPCCIYQPAANASPAAFTPAHQRPLWRMHLDD